MESKDELKEKLIEKLEKELQEYKGYLRHVNHPFIILNVNFGLYFR